MRIDDDGSTVIVDLHGLTVHDALQTVRVVLRLAQRRGRNVIQFVHGSSTTAAGGKPTIKSELYRFLESPEAPPTAAGALRTQNTLVLPLPFAPADRARITLLEVQRLI